MLMLVMIDASIATRGFSIAITGMLIVFVVLILICLFITALPRVLVVVEPFLPAVEHRHGPALSASSRGDGAFLEDDAVLAGIGFVLHTEFQKASSARESH